MNILTYYELRKFLNNLTGEDLGKAVIFKNGGRSYTIKDIEVQNDFPVLLAAYQIPKTLEAKDV